MLTLFAAFMFLAFPTGHIRAYTCDSFRAEASGQPVSDISAIPSGVDVTFKFDLTDSQPAAYDPAGSFTAVFSSGPNIKDVKPVGGVISFTQNASSFEQGKTYTIRLDYKPPTGNLIPVCNKSFGISATESGNCSITINPVAPSVRDTITATVTLNKTGNYELVYDPTGGRARRSIQGLTQGINSNISITNYGLGNARLFVATNVLASHLCDRDFQVTENGGATLESQFTDLCSFVKDTTNKGLCDTCTKLPGIWTAIGCIPATPNGFVQRILPFAIGIGGGIAFLLMLFGGLQIMTSAGNPEKLNAGRELVTSAIVGLLLIIFSVFLLKLIGADILGIPGFS